MSGSLNSGDGWKGGEHPPVLSGAERDAAAEAGMTDAEFVEWRNVTTLSDYAALLARRKGEN